MHPPEVQNCPLLDEFMGSTMEGRKLCTMLTPVLPSSSLYQHQTHKMNPSGQVPQLNQ